MKYLENMRKGEEARDATPKIKGFLFQDYYTIELLLDDNVEWIKVEYVEDIIFKEKNNNVYHIIQAKYSQNKVLTNTIYLEAQKSLYYQFLKSKLFNSNNNCIYFSLLSTSNNNQAFSLSNPFVNEPLDLKSLELQYSQNICKENLSTRMDFIFQNMHTKINFKEFNCKFIQRNTIEEYKEDLEEKLSEKYNSDSGELLFFISYGYVQKYGYLDSEKTIYKENFNSFINEIIIGENNDEKLSLIFLSYINLVYSDILDTFENNDSVTSDKLKIYHDIFTKFKNCIDTSFIKILKTTVTCSKRDSKNWIIENKYAITNWIKEIWKIPYNYIFEEKIKLDNLNINEILTHQNLFLLNNLNDKNGAFLTQFNEGEKSKERRKLLTFLQETNHYPEILFIRNETIKDINYTLDITKIQAEETYDITNAEISQTAFCHCKKCITIDDEDMFSKDDTNTFFERRCCNE